MSGLGGPEPRVDERVLPVLLSFLPRTVSNIVNSCSLLCPDPRKSPMVLSFPVPGGYSCPEVNKVDNLAYLGYPAGLGLIIGGF